MAVRSVVGPTRLGVGFTLVEVLLSLALAAIVLSSMQSLIVIAGRAAPDADGPQRATVDAADALERLASEVSVAVEVTELDSHEVGFTVNDWTGDGVVETIKYGWSGTPGDPLLRAVNGGDAAVVVDGVRRFEVGAETSTRNVFIAGDGEHLHDQRVQSVGVLDGLPDPVDTTRAYAQRIVPALPANTEKWRVRRVALWFAGAGSDGDVIVEIQGVDGSSGQPNGNVYKRERFDSDVLGSVMQRVEVELKTPELAPGEQVCIVVRARDTDVDCEVSFGTATAVLGSRTGHRSTDGGGTWSTVSGFALRHEVFAEVWTHQGRTETRENLRSLTVLLSAGYPPVTVHRTVSPLNTPKVLP